MPKKAELLLCTLQQFLFSPKGDVEGLLVRVKSKPLQISVPPHVGAALSRTHQPGQRLKIHAHRDDSPRTAAAPHPVYKFDALAERSGKQAPGARDEEAELKGVVAALHYAKHGEPNGVILKSGAFIHLRPHGMAEAGLAVGSRLTASGRLRNTVLGTPILEASRVNRIELG